jgi:CubicO group peptidase (beta-lactamase class C family)
VAPERDARGFDAADVRVPRIARVDAAVAELAERLVVEPGVAPAAVIAWWREGHEVRVGAAGGGVSVETPFDLASVTKPATALAAARLVAAGRASFDATVGDVLGLDAPASVARLDELLAHRAGLPAWGAIYRDDLGGVREGAIPSLPPRSPDALPTLGTMLARAASRLEARPTGLDAEPLYSDLGYVLAGAMVAKLGEAPLASQWRSAAGLRDAATFRRDEPDFDARVPPTEIVAWRGEVRGVVHDENAYFLELAGGHPGHAGAFGSALAVLSMARAFLEALDGAAVASRASGVMLPRELAAFLIEPRARGSHRIGWDSVTPGASSTGRHFGPRTFGHLGFTGTSVWCDPDARAIAVILTNRTYPSRANAKIREARPRVHDALWALRS